MVSWVRRMNGRHCRPPAQIADTSASLKALIMQMLNGAAQTKERANNCWVLIKKMTHVRTQLRSQPSRGTLRNSSSCQRCKGCGSTLPATNDADRRVQFARAGAYVVSATGMESFGTNLRPQACCRYSNGEYSTYWVKCWLGIATNLQIDARWVTSSRVCRGSCRWCST